MGKLYGTEVTLVNLTELAFLDSSEVRRASRGVTLDSTKWVADGDGRKIVRAGTVIGYDGSSHKYEEIDLGDASTLSFGDADDEDLIVLTAKVGGTTGDDISVILTANSNDSRATTDVQYDEYLKQITVHLKNANAAITATALQVIAALNITEAVKATVTLGGSNSKVKVTARDGGFVGNRMSLALVNPGPNGSLAVTVNDLRDIVVTLATAATNAAVAATRVFFDGVANKEITITANEAGDDGNNISVEIVDPAGNNQVLTVSIVAVNTIRVSCATNGGGAITSTAKQVADAINADYEAHVMVTAAYDGTGGTTVTADAGGALSGGTDEGAGVITSTAAQVIAAINAHDQAREIVYAENGTSSNGTGTVVAAGATALLGGSDVPPVTAANGTGSDGSGVVSEEAETHLAGGGERNVDAAYITAETVELTQGDALVGCFDRARVRVSRLITTLDDVAKEQLVAAGFTLVE